MGRHCLDDLAHLLMCQVTFHHCCLSVELVKWHCHIAVIVGMHNGGGRSNHSCTSWWSLSAMVSQRMWVVAEDGGGSWERKVLFVDVHLMFLGNTAYAAQYKERIVA
jgi:hypothetical protein